MKIDIHCHVVGNGRDTNQVDKDVYFNPQDNPHWFTRIHLIPEILKTFPPAWLVHGTDFPIPVDSWPHLPWVTHHMTFEEYIQISKTQNPFDRDIRIKRAHGFSNSILENAEKVLRL